MEISWGIGWIILYLLVLAYYVFAVWTAWDAARHGTKRFKKGSPFWFVLIWLFPFPVAVLYWIAKKY